MRGGRAGGVMGCVASGRGGGTLDRLCCGIVTAEKTPPGVGGVACMGVDGGLTKALLLGPGRQEPEPPPIKTFAKMVSFGPPAVDVADSGGVSGVEGEWVGLL